MNEAIRRNYKELIQQPEIMEKMQQVAVVTGAASGIGSAISRKLVTEGYRVALFDIKKTDASSIGDRAMSYVVDVTSEESVRDAVARVYEDWGNISILVNSAGIAGPAGIKTHELPAADMERVFRVNFMGSFFLSKHVLPVMLKQNYGRVLHIASIAGKEGNPGMLAYSASKAAVIGMVKVQGKEYAETGITINGLAPAVIMTDLVEQLPASQVSYMTDKIPMKRCGTLKEVADMAAYIVSPENSFTTAFVFDLSGGRATY